MAEGKHPFPSRTRKLSPPAPMVLPGRLGGRVGRRRDIVAGEPPSGGFLAFVASRSDFGSSRRVRGHAEVLRSLAQRAGSPARPTAHRVCRATWWASFARTAVPGQAEAAICAARAGGRAAGARRPAAAASEARRPRPSRPDRPRCARSWDWRYYEAGRTEEAYGAEGLPADVRARRPEPPDRRCPAGCGKAASARSHSPTRRSRPRRAAGEAKAEAVIVARFALADMERYEEALGVAGVARGRETSVAGPTRLRVWYTKGDILERAGGARRRPRSSARSCATTRPRSTPPNGWPRSADGGVPWRGGLPLPSLAPVASEALGVHPDRAEGVVAGELEGRAAGRRRVRTPPAPDR